MVHQTYSSLIMIAVLYFQGLEAATALAILERVAGTGSSACQACTMACIHASLCVLLLSVVLA